MKHLFLILFIVSSFLVALTSCGSDDGPEPVKEPQHFTGTCEQTLSLIGFQNATVQIPEVATVLDDMLRGNINYGTPIAGGVLNFAPLTSVIITGLKPGVVLKDFSLTINGIQHSFDDITTDRVILYNSGTIDYFTQAFNAMVASKDKTMRSKAEFTPSRDLLRSDDVNVQIIFNGTFFYFK